MAIVVEDGTVVSGANSYVTEAELSAFASARNVTLSATYSTEELLILAMDYIESLNFIGFKYLDTQTLQWPRVDVYIDGYYNDIDNIPTELKNGLMQTALAIDAGNSPQQNAPRKTIREKVDGLEIEYSASSSSVVIDRKVLGFLRKLLSSSGGQMRVGKG